MLPSRDGINTVGRHAVHTGRRCHDESQANLRRLSTRIRRTAFQARPPVRLMVCRTGDNASKGALSCMDQNPRATESRAIRDRLVTWLPLGGAFRPSMARTEPANARKPMIHVDVVQGRAALCPCGALMLAARRPAIVLGRQSCGWPSEPRVPSGFATIPLAAVVCMPLAGPEQSWPRREHPASTLVPNQGIQALSAVVPGSAEGRSSFSRDS